MMNASIDYLVPISNYGALLMQYKCGMIQLTNEQWERIQKHFPEEHIANGRPGLYPGGSAPWRWDYLRSEIARWSEVARVARVKS